jgi:hypothetical protein
MTFVNLGPDRVALEYDIRDLDTSRLERYFEVTVRLRSGEKVMLQGQRALDAVMALKPSAIEGKNLRFARHAWAFHNLVAHPVLQILAWCGRPDLGFRIHDATVPRPLGVKYPAPVSDAAE